MVFFWFSSVSSLAWRGDGMEAKTTKEAFLGQWIGLRIVSRKF